MPGKGHAFEKPTVNAEHKQALRQQARLIADKSAATKDCLKKALRDIVEADHDFPAHRKRDAYLAIDQALALALALAFALACALCLCLCTLCLCCCALGLCRVRCPPHSRPRPRAGDEEAQQEREPHERSLIMLPI